MWPHVPRRRAPRAAVVGGALLCAGALPGGAEITAPESPPGIGMERGVAIIRCTSAQAPPRRFLARGAIIDFGSDDPASEVILTAAHGLPESAEAVRRECSVWEGPRRSYAIEDAWLGGYPGDKQHDWAVLRTARGFGAAAGRLRLAQLEPGRLARLLEQEAPARLLLRRAESEQERCHLGDLWLTSADVAAGLFLHSCRSWEGLSGSPILVGMNGEPVVVGIQLGRVRRPLTLEGPAYLQLGRAIDSAIAAAIAQAATTPDRAR